MAQLGYAYDPRAYEPEARPEPFPAGRYAFMVTSTDVRRTKAGDGSYLVVEHEVQGGQHHKRRFYNQVTLENPNPQAVEIGLRQLSALCHAVGYLEPLTDSDVLHGRTGEAEVVVEPAGIDQKSGKAYDAKNAVKRYVLPGQNIGAASARVQLA